MIYTVTFSPCLDYYLGVSKFTVGAINRSEYERYEAGGKGINVSMLVTHLGYKSIALGFIGGFTGAYVQSLLEKEGISTDFVVTAGLTRTNIKIESDQETAINANGPHISEAEINLLLKKLDEIGPDDFLAVAGNVPSSLPDSIYELIMQRMKNKKARIVIDATGKLLLKTLPYHPFLVKPNEEELSEIIGRKFGNEDEIISAARHLQDLGALNVIVSRGAAGAVMVDMNGKTYSLRSPQGKVVSTVGAGDSMVGGFIAGVLKFGDFEKAFRLGLASGSATAFSGHIADKAKITQVYEKVFGSKGECL